MTRKRVYVCGPVSRGDLLPNVRQADEAFFALMRAGFAPLNPLLSVFAGSADRSGPSLSRVTATADPLPGGTTHGDWMAADLPWVAVADAVLRLPGESVGADLETAHAAACGVPVFHDLESLAAHFARP